jgi:hypothetical protein
MTNQPKMSNRAERFVKAIGREVANRLSPQFTELRERIECLEVMLAAAGKAEENAQPEELEAAIARPDPRTDPHRQAEPT